MPLSLNFHILANLLKDCCIPPFYGLLERKVTFEVAIGPILKYSIRPKEFKNAIIFFSFICPPSWIYDVIVWGINLSHVPITLK